MSKPKKIERNSYVVRGSVTTLTITRNTGKQISVKIDTIDRATVEAFRWRLLTGTGRQVVTGQGQALRSLPSLLVTAPEGLTTYCANGDTLDCRRSNLTTGTPSDYMSAGHRRAGRGTCGSVGYDRSSKRWRATGRTNGHKRPLIGYFPSRAEAVEACQAFDAERKAKRS